MVRIGPAHPKCVVHAIASTVTDFGALKSFTFRDPDGLDLHRRDRDPGWPQLAAQLVGSGAAEPCTAPTLVAAAGYAVAEILTFLDGGAPEILGAATEISSPGRLRRRAWPPHPGCSCTRRRGAPRRPPGRP